MLKPYWEATVCLGADRDITISFVVPVLNGIKKFIQPNVLAETNYVCNLKTTLLNNFDSRFSAYMDNASLHQLAAALDPLVASTGHSVTSDIWTELTVRVQQRSETHKHHQQYDNSISNVITTLSASSIIISIINNFIVTIIVRMDMEETERAEIQAEVTTFTPAAQTEGQFQAKRKQQRPQVSSQQVSSDALVRSYRSQQSQHLRE